MIPALIYIVLLVSIIHFSGWFRKHQLNHWKFSAAFMLKVTAGLALTYIYTYHYKDRSTADIFKYYDDAQVMYSAMDKNPVDYLKMLSGIGNDNEYFNEKYYNHMNHWFKRYDMGMYNDNHTIIRFNALLMPISMGSFHVHTVVMCFISFLGLLALFITVCRYFPDKKGMIYVSVFFIPSVVFWGSGVLKEGILLFAIGTLVYSFFQLFIEKKIKGKYIFILTGSIVLQLINKGYLLMVVLPPLLCFWMAEKYQVKRTVLFYLSCYFVFGLSAYAYVSFSGKDPLQSIVAKRRDFINLVKGGTFVINDKYIVRLDPDKKYFLDTVDVKQFKIKPGASYMYWSLNNFSDTLYKKNNTDSSVYNLVWDLPVAGSYIPVCNIKPEWGQVLAHVPEALCIAVLQPHLLNAQNSLEKLAALENLLLILALLVSLIWRERKKINWNWLCLCLYTVLSLYLIAGFTAPVAGAIVRYKMPVLTFWMFMVINLFSKEAFTKSKLFQFLSRLLLKMRN